MKINMGDLDRVIRVAVAGLVLMMLYSGLVTGTWSLILGIIAAIFIITGVVGNCPLYSLLGFNTCPRKTTES
jgi:ammonia channel protein AmtB